MKLKLDENFPGPALRLLVELGHDTHTVADEGLLGASDERLWERVEGEGRLLLTRDKDFTDRRVLYSRTGAGVAVFRLSDQGWRAVIARLSELSAHLEGWAGHQVIIRDDRVRLKAFPPGPEVTSGG